MQSDPASATEPPRTVLVVDDDRDIADGLRDLLEMIGYRVLVAYDGDAGVATAIEQRPAVAILDIHMPRMGGIVACTRIREDPAGAGIKLVALTGSDRPEDREAAELAGFDHFLMKPVMVGALVHLLQQGNGR